MASPPLLDFQALTAPVPGEQPAGAPVPFEVRARLDEFRKEDAPDDPTSGGAARKADWPGIVKLAEETLKTKSKDLMSAARLTEALTRTRGFPGLRDGLRLLREMVEKCWDRMYPELVDGDLEVRAGPFNWLDDADRGARFPHTVRTAPVLKSGGVTVSRYDWDQAKESKGKITKEEIDKVMAGAALPDCEAVAADIGEAKEELRKLVAALKPRLAAEAPSLSNLAKAVDDSNWLVQQALQKLRPAPAAAPAGSPAETGKPAAALSGARTRKEIYHTLEQAANQLMELEPHSPIPYLIKRAVLLGNMKFPEMIKELVRVDQVLKDMNRELGIPDGARPGQPPARPTGT